MKYLRKILILVSLLSIGLVACTNYSISITNKNNQNLEVGETLQLEYVKSENLKGDVTWTTSNDNAEVSETGLVVAKIAGEVIVTIELGKYSDSITIIVTEFQLNEDAKLTLSSNIDKLFVGESNDLIVQLISIETNEVINEDLELEFTFELLQGEGLVSFDKNTMTAIDVGLIEVIAKFNDLTSNSVILEIINSDPYLNIDKDEFYENYSPASSYLDAHYRTLNNLMSGSIEDQLEDATIADYQPGEGNLLLRNTSVKFSEDNNTYYVVDGMGNIVNQIYKNAAYVTLDEVAAYLFAFGQVPANYLEIKTGDPRVSPWGKFLRLNNTAFTGNIERFPYQPILPNIQGIGGDLYYHEVDIGTTGTNSNPAFPGRIYNDGYNISRGAARIVYTRFDVNRELIEDPNDKFLFYTYNHYNDFQEYLNYQDGWGEMFGNITGGGVISSEYDYNPTPYIDVVLRDFLPAKSNMSIYGNMYLNSSYRTNTQEIYIN